MRKYSAIFALILTLWGTFSPLGISIVTNTENRTNTEQKSVSVNIETQRAFAEPDPATDTPPDSGNSGADEAKNELDCFYTDIFCGIFKIIITFILFIPNALAAVTGLLMDFSLYISINPGVYGVGGNSVETGLRDAWAMIRDFSNIGFIFALFVIAFSLILNKDLLNFSPKKGIVRVIIMALLVNFSFLMCRLIIQGADIFSHLIYKQITSEEPRTTTGLGGLSASNLLTAVGAKTPSLKILSHVGPQQAFISSGTVVEKTLGGALTETISTTSNPLDLALIVPRAIMNYNGKGWEFYITYGLMAVVSFFIYVILIFTFVSVTFIFLGRIFGLWLGIIVSPLAFVSHAIPMLEDNKFIGFNNWLKSFIELAFVTPIFIFFMYLTVVVFNMDSIIPASLSSNGLVSILLRQLLPAIGATFLLLKGKKIATDMAGEIGVVAGKFSGALTGLALGAATGGTAMLARQTVGRAGAAVANSFANNNTAIGRGMRSMGTRLGAASFDVRKSERLMGGFSKFTETAGGAPIDLGKRGMREGGFAAEGTLSEQLRKRQERIAAEQKEKLEKDAADALLNAQAKDAQELREREAELALAKSAKEAEEAKIAMEAENQGPGMFLDKQNNSLAEKENNRDKLLGEMDALDDKTLVLSLDRATIETSQATLLTENSDLENALVTLNADKSALETQLAAIPNDGSVMSREEKARITGEIAAKDTEIQTKQTKLASNITALATGKEDLKKKDKEIDDHMKVIEKKESEVEKAEEEITKISSAGAILANVTSVRDARQKRKDLDLEAANSLEKAAMEKEKEDMETKNTKREEEQKKLSALVKKKEEAEKANNKEKAREIQLEIDEQTKERDKKDKEYNEAKARHKKAKAAYDKEFGNKIKTLEDFEKETLKLYDENKDVMKRRKDATDKVITAQKAVNASQNNIDNINYEFQQKYADDLEKNNPSGGFKGVVGTVTGGALFGGSVRDASAQAATGVRKKITGK